jgi:hypothetical protein
VRANAAAVLAALSLIVLALYLCGLLPGLTVIVAATLGFISAWTGILAGTGGETTGWRRRTALAAAGLGVVVVISATGILLSGSLLK